MGEWKTNRDRNNIQELNELFQQSILNEDKDLNTIDVRQKIIDRESFVSTEETVCDLFDLIADVKCPYCNEPIKALSEGDRSGQREETYYCHKCYTRVQVKMPLSIVISFAQRTRVWEVVRTTDIELLLTGPCVNIVAKITNRAMEAEKIVARVYCFNGKIVIDYWDERAKEDLNAIKAIQKAHEMIGARIV